MNLMLMTPHIDELVQLVLDERVPVVTTGAGNPGKYMDALKDMGIKVLPIAPSTALARRLESIGADAIIGEGMEAGGHIGELTTMVSHRSLSTRSISPSWLPEASPMVAGWPRRSRWAPRACRWYTVHVR